MATTTPKTIKVPKTLGACADRLYAIKAEIAKLQLPIDALDAERKAIKMHVIETLPKSEASGIAGKVARVTVVTKEVPQVKDWELFYAYVRRTKRNDLLQKRVSETAIKEIWEAGKKVPGVERYNNVDISLVKV